jgi:hypothetical protein
MFDCELPRRLVLKDRTAEFAHSHPNDVLDLRIMRRARFLHANNIRQRGVPVLTKGRKNLLPFSDAQ